MATPKSLWLPWHDIVPLDQATAIPRGLPLSLIQESTFVQMVRFERRRTERSGRPFMLVLLNSREFSSRDGIELVDTIAREVSARTRETDVLGWYEQDRTLGLLMTEIGEASLLARSNIEQKISAVVLDAIQAESFRQLTMSFHLFPEEMNTECHDRGDYTFFPDLARRSAARRQSEALKRGVDIVVSLAALIFFLPLIFIISVLVKLTSPGPVLFCQKRVGQYGKEFEFLKFRTMTVGNDPTLHREYIAKLIAGTGEDTAGAKPFYKLTNDPRITPLGRFLRRTSLDELPQFLNILQCDMSLVGPRPPLPYEYERYLPWHKRRVHELKPGLTGFWQVCGRSRTNFNDMVRMDLRYAAMRSFWVDCRIILQTPAAMISGRGAC